MSRRDTLRLIRVIRDIRGKLAMGMLGPDGAKLRGR